MATLAQLTGAAVVLATFHVTACAVLPVQETAVFGAVTWNGPAAVVTLKRHTGRVDAAAAHAIVARVRR